jgi:hypothetical protein
VFTVELHGVPAFVIVVETSRSESDYSQISNHIFKYVKDYNNIDLLAVCVCQPETLSRYSRYNLIRMEYTARLFKNGRLKSSMVEMRSRTLKSSLQFSLSKYVEPPRPTIPRFQVSFGAIRGRVPVDEKSNTPMTAFSSITNILIWRAEKYPDDPLFVIDDPKKKERGDGKVMSSRKFHSRVVALASYLFEKKGIQPEKYVLVIFSHCVEFITTIHAVSVFSEPNTFLLTLPATLFLFP